MQCFLWAGYCFSYWGYSNKQTLPIIFLLLTWTRLDRKIQYFKFEEDDSLLKRLNIPEKEESESDDTVVTWWYKDNIDAKYSMRQPGVQSIEASQFEGSIKHPSRISKGKKGKNINIASHCYSGKKKISISRFWWFYSKSNNSFNFPMAWECCFHFINIKLLHWKLQTDLLKGSLNFSDER